MSEHMHERPEPAHERDTFRKVLHVPVGYGHGEYDSALEQVQLDIFRAHGYDIVEDDPFDADSPMEMGIGVQTNVRDGYERDQRIAYEAGVRMPESFDVRAMLEYPGAVIAKPYASDRGDLKYLLESPEQKRRFVAWFIAQSNLDTLFKDGDIDDDLVQNLLTQVANGEVDQEKLEGWIFEEQIITPGTYNTSFRVVVDAFGRVHYSQVARSAAPKGVDADPSITHTTPLPRSMGDMWGADTSILLAHPDSPFYIAPKHITSNISTGGVRLRLNGVSAESPEDRTALQELGINPDEPRLPVALHDTSSTIGRLSRGEYPFVGVDYLIDERTGEYVMLEINTGPHLDPQALGLAPDADETACEIALLENMLAHSPLR
ncbi:MAG TPA: hypothetical protein VFH06_04130 [Candidatus Saccharimonadales bacterium]|nr:hypothetical protein [Candidatus Saccharimonadales bacterium]